jgi:alanine racemase
MTSAPLLRPTQAQIDLGAIAHNTRVLKAHRPHTRLCAVVKADAYGHGAVAVAQATLRAGAHGVAVALVEEALALRAAGIGAPIYVLAGHYGGAYDAIVAHRLIPVVGQPVDLAGLNQAALRAGVRQDVHLEIDTGMARLGFAAEELLAAARYAQGCQHLDVVGTMTHLSHADEPEAPSTPRQIAAFDAACAEALALLPKLTIRHVLNSGGLVCSAPEHPWDMVRCGLALYGVQPVTDHLLGPLRPALRWVTQPVALRRLAVGEPVSYGSHWRATRPSTIATLPVGYADGYPRTMSHRAHVLIGGMRAPVVGTICMDLCMVDVTDIEDVTLASEVVLLGSQGQHTLCATTLGRWADTIAYEILARIGPRVPRCYLEAPP